PSARPQVLSGLRHGEIGAPIRPLPCEHAACLPASRNAGSATGAFLGAPLVPSGRSPCPASGDIPEHSRMEGSCPEIAWLQTSASRVWVPRPTNEAFDAEADHDRACMPQVDVDGLTINYEVQGEGEPLLLIPYTS